MSLSVFRYWKKVEERIKEDGMNKGGECSGSLKPGRWTAKFSETSVRNYQATPRNITEDRNSDQQSCDSLQVKSERPWPSPQQSVTGTDNKPDQIIQLLLTYWVIYTMLQHESLSSIQIYRLKSRIRFKSVPCVTCFTPSSSKRMPEQTYILGHLAGWWTYSFLVVPNTKLRNPVICNQYQLYRVIKNDCRGFNNSSHTIHLRLESVVGPMDQEILKFFFYDVMCAVVMHFSAWSAVY